MELSSIKSDVNATDVTIKHPVSGEETDIVIKVISKDTPEYRTMMTKLAMEKKKKGQSDAQWRDDKSIRLIAACVVGWSGMDLNGVEYQYSKENAEELLGDPGYRWLYEQVAEAVHNRSNFFKDAASN